MSLAPIGPLLLVGSGKMGAALLRGWLAQGMLPQSVTVAEPSQAAAREFLDAGVRWSDGVIAPEVPPRVVVLAVKPQTMDAVLPSCRAMAARQPLFLSIAAGKTIAYFEDRLGRETPIVRSMPNTPASVGCGITVACANAAVTDAQRSLSTLLLGAVGEVAWVEEEPLLDAVTALSGGGPAYVFLLVECLAEAGRHVGLPSDLAMRLARATVAGSGELLRRSEEPPATLRQNVTSPKGTTLEALNILMSREGLQPLLTRAIAAATRRSRELAD